MHYCTFVAYFIKNSCFMIFCVVFVIAILPKYFYRRRQNIESIVLNNIKVTLFSTLAVYRIVVEALIALLLTPLEKKLEKSIFWPFWFKIEYNYNSFWNLNVNFEVNNGQSLGVKMSKEALWKGIWHFYRLCINT